MKPDDQLFINIYDFWLELEPLSPSYFYSCAFRLNNALELTYLRAILRRKKRDYQTSFLTFKNIH